MANNERTQSDAVWIDGYTVPASDWEDLERKIFGSWNGDKGGAYRAPPGARGAAYTINGSGFQVTGPTRLSYGGTIYGDANQFVIRDNTWPMLEIGHAGRTRSIVCPIHRWSLSRMNIPLTAGDRQNRLHLWSTRHPYAGVGSVALACRQTNSRTVETADLYTPLRVIDGATLNKVTLFYRIATKRKFAPIEMPKMRVLRVPKDSGDVFQTVLPEPLKDTTDGSGYAFTPIVTSPDTWYNDGEVQSFEYECDQNNEIDVDTYDYVVQIVEERGALTPDDEFDGVRYVERKLDVFLVGDNSETLTGEQTIDGSTTFSSNGPRILIVDTDAVLATGEPATTGASAKNGIWIGADPGNWARATDLNESDDFTPNFIVRATSGGINANATWQCDYPSNTQKISLTTGVSGSLTNTQPRIQPAEPKGNIYHCLVPEFDITTLRHQ